MAFMKREKNFKRPAESTWDEIIMYNFRERYSTQLRIAFILTTDDPDWYYDMFSKEKDVFFVDDFVSKGIYQHYNWFSLSKSDIWTNKYIKDIYNTSSKVFRESRSLMITSLQNLQNSLEKFLLSLSATYRTEVVENQATWKWLIICQSAFKKVIFIQAIVFGFPFWIFATLVISVLTRKFR